jgi:predicted RNA-binding protein
MGEGSEKPIMQEIAHLRIDGDTIEIETLFGEGKIVQGRVAEIDFMKSRVVIEE